MTERIVTKAAQGRIPLIPRQLSLLTSSGNVVVKVRKVEAIETERRKVSLEEVISMVKRLSDEIRSDIPTLMSLAEEAVNDIQTVVQAVKTAANELKIYPPDAEKITRRLVRDIVLSLCYKISSLSFINTKNELSEIINFHFDEFESGGKR